MSRALTAIAIVACGAIIALAATILVASSGSERSGGDPGGKTPEREDKAPGAVIGQRLDREDLPPGCEIPTHVTRAGFLCSTPVRGPSNSKELRQQFERLRLSQ